MDEPPIKTIRLDLGMPKQLGKYPLLKVIGKGSMGILYESVDPHIKRRVALKTIRRDLLDDGDVEDFAARFRVEAQAAGRLAHPGIVSIFEYGEQEAISFIAMEFVEGRSLRECVDQKVRFTIAQAVSIVSQLLEALQYAHDRGVWHRDIKPANILMMENGRVKVTDFGIARIESSALTQVGVIMGTPGYIAPEMYLGKVFDSRVDVFAAGVVLYQLLAGCLPFEGTVEKVMFKVCYEKPVPPSIAARLPSLQPFDAVVMQALAAKPEERFTSAAAMLGALRQAQVAAGGAVGSDETIIVKLPAAVTPSPAPVVTTGAAPSTPSPAPAGKDSTTKPPSTDTLQSAGWNMEELDRIEKRLARYLGPIAKIMVRRTARKTSDIVTLTRLLGEKLTEAQREEFLTAVGVMTAPAKPAQQAKTGPAIGSKPIQSTESQRLLTPEDVARASQLLTAQMGPIAAVLAKRAAKPGCTREQFIAALASHLGDDAARTRFIDSFR